MQAGELPPRPSPRFDLLHNAPQSMLKTTDPLA